MKRTTVIAAIAALAVLPLTAASLYQALHHNPDPVADTGRGPYRGSEPPAGIYAPDFTLRTYDGKSVRMAKLRGRVVLTTFVVPTTAWLASGSRLHSAGKRRPLDSIQHPQGSLPSRT